MSALTLRRLIDRSRHCWYGDVPPFDDDTSLVVFHSAIARVSSDFPAGKCVPLGEVADIPLPSGDLTRLFTLHPRPDSGIVMSPRPVGLETRIWSPALAASFSKRYAGMGRVDNIVSAQSECMLHSFEVHTEDHATHGYLVCRGDAALSRLSESARPEMRRSVAEARQRLAETVFAPVYDTGTGRGRTRRVVDVPTFEGRRPMLLGVRMRRLARHPLVQTDFAFFEEAVRSPLIRAIFRGKQELRTVGSPEEPILAVEWHVPRAGAKQSNATSWAFFEILPGWWGLRGRSTRRPLPLFSRQGSQAPVVSQDATGAAWAWSASNGQPLPVEEFVEGLKGLTVLPVRTLTITVWTSWRVCTCRIEECVPGKATVYDRHWVTYYPPAATLPGQQAESAVKESLSLPWFFLPGDPSEPLSIEYEIRFRWDGRLDGLWMAGSGGASGQYGPRDLDVTTRQTSARAVIFDNEGEE